MNFLRTLKSEFRRIISDKKLVYITLGVLALFIVVISIFLVTNTMSLNPQFFEPHIETCQSGFERYQKYYLYLTGATQERPGILFDNTMTAEMAKERMEYFAFMLKNNGDTYKFLDLSKYYGQSDPNPYDIPPSSVGALAQVWIMNNSFYVLLFAAVLISVLICVKPYSSGIMKNYYASPVKKSTLFAGKLTACLSVCFFFWFIVLIWGLCFGVVGEPVYVLHYDGTAYNTYGLNGVFVTKMLGTLIAMFFVSALTALIGRCTGNGLLSALIVIVVCVLFAVIFEVNVSMSGFTAVGKCLLPVIGLRANHFIAADWGMWVLYAVYAILVAALFAACVIATQKQRN